jgi:hypothetical protein
LESEALLLGIWRNVEDLESALSLPELEAILSASREREHRQNKFLAALQGVDLDKHQQEESEEAFDRIQRRAYAKLSGMSEEMIEHGEFGMDFEIED